MRMVVTDMMNKVMRGLKREKELLKKEIINENLEREKRKLEWKKLNILTKEKLREERIN